MYITKPAGYINIYYICYASRS